MLGNPLYACCKCIHLWARFGAHSERDAIPHAAANHSNLTGRRSVHFPPPAPVLFFLRHTYRFLPCRLNWSVASKLPESQGLRPGCAVSFSGNGGCTYEFTRTYLYELERISGRRFFVQDNSSDVQQFAREGCATLRKYAKLS